MTERRAPFIAVVANEVGDYQRMLLRGIEGELAGTGYVLLVAVSHPRNGHDGDALMRFMDAGWVRGLVITALAGEESERTLCEHAQACGVPVVSIARRQLGIADVEVDNAAGMTRLMDHLLDECGVRRPAFVRGHVDNVDSQEREAVFLAALERRGLQVPESYLLMGAFHREAAYRAVTALLTSGSTPDAVVAANDEMAFGVLEALAQQGLRAPEDVLVTGFDNIPEARTVPRDLTTVDQDLLGQGRLAARLLLTELADPATVSPPPPVSSVVVVRGSTRRAAREPATDPEESGVSGLEAQLVQVSRSLAGVDDEAGLVRELSAHLPRLGMRSCFLVLPVDGAAGADGAESRLVLAYSDGQVMPDAAPDAPVFAMTDPLPAGLAGRLGTRVVMQALFAGLRQHGYLLYEQVDHDDTGAVCDLLQITLSRVLDTMAREQALQEHALELERLVALRTRQLQDEVATRRTAEERLRRANSELELVSLRDELTGVGNRRAFNEALRRHWSRCSRAGRPLGLVLCDVDFFKLFNDRYGHQAGDDCLRLVAGCLTAAVTRDDDLCARYGGEEFAILLPFTAHGGTGAVATRLLERVRALELPHADADAGIVTVSVGWAVAFPGQSDGTDALVRAADLALYTAKTSGRNRVAEGVGAVVVDAG